MRILMLSQFYAPILGGEEQCVRSMSAELVARGHEVSVVTQRLAGAPDFEVDRGIRVYRIRGTLQRMTGLFSESGRTHAPPFPDPELTTELYRVIRREQPRIVHAHNWMGYQYLPLQAFKDAKLVVSLHDMSLVCAKKSYMYGDAPCTGPALTKCFRCAMEHFGPTKGVVTTVGSWAMNLAERRTVDMFLPVSQATAIENRLVGTAVPYEVLPNFLPENLGEADADVEPYLAQLPKEPYLLFVGGLRRIKGVNHLLAAYAQLQAPPPLVLVGYQAVDTPSEFPPGVTVVKNWPHAAAVAAWRGSLFGLVPSVCVETFGLVVLEAIVSGRPVIASRIGGLADIVVDGATGMLVPPGDVGALRDAIQYLLDRPDVRERMGQQAQKQSALYRASVIVPRLEQVYERLLKPNAHGHTSALGDTAPLLTSRGTAQTGNHAEVVSSRALSRPGRDPASATSDGQVDGDRVMT
jgi:glycosyltransferase involved in cell wall biosynthesis